ncbi:MAG: LacI family DNA-binding transcriptional regulator [bacterium]
MKKNKPKKSLPTTSQRATSADVARKLGISVMTVSRALNNRPNVKEETREQVFSMAMKMGYVPDLIAKSLVLRRTLTIGVVVPEITHSFFPEAIRGIEEAIYPAGYHLILTHSAEKAEREKDALQTLESKRVDGVLISTIETGGDVALYKHVIERGTPVVFFDRCVYGIGASCVCIDDEASAQAITAHLIEHGYTRVAHLCGSQHVSIARARFNGYKKALKKGKLALMEELVAESGFHEQGGYGAMQKLLRLPVRKRPRAVVAVNDPAAFGAIKAIQENGLKIPDVVAIVGFSDDIRAALIPTPLTTVRQPAYLLGKRAAEELLAIIEGNSAAGGEIVIATEQVIRQSCGCNRERR